MKLLTYSFHGRDFVGTLDRECRNILPIEGYSSMLELIESGIPVGDMAGLVKYGAGIPLADVAKRAPIPNPRQEIICLGLNYAAHAEEAARAPGKGYGTASNYAVYFGKRAYETIGDGSYIPSHRDITENTLDYETELAVIIGKDAFRVAGENAYDYVFGYTVFNDVSARNIQTRHQQYYLGKSLDGFCPLGPWIVTEDEFKRPPSLGLRTRINGEVRQDSNTDMMIFDIPYIISDLSMGIVLKAGTIIATGTPAGVGMGFSPPRYLKTGDVVECEVDGIGVLRNEVL